MAAHNKQAPAKTSGATGEMAKTEGIVKKTKKQKAVMGSLRKVSMTVGLVIAIIVFGSIAFITTLTVMANARNLKASNAEYEYMRQLADEMESGSNESGTIRHGALDQEMLGINPDYVCWIKVEGTDIDYPVVRGYDNEKYLTLSFNGEENIAGTIFMDYRNRGSLLTYDLEEAFPHIIIYGHNIKRGGMFGGLRKYLDEQYMEEHPIITLIIDDQIVEFKIFSARQTDIDDPAYFLHFDEPQVFSRFANKIDAPLAATQIITLSTCVSTGDNDARMIVQGYRLLGSH